MSARSRWYRLVEERQQAQPQERRADSFLAVAREHRVRPGIVAAAYYRHARAEGLAIAAESGQA